MTTEKKPYGEGGEGKGEDVLRPDSHAPPKGPTDPMVGEQLKRIADKVLSNVGVELKPGRGALQSDIVLWEVIRKSQERVSYQKYTEELNEFLHQDGLPGGLADHEFHGIDAYKRIHDFTDDFLLRATPCQTDVDALKDKLRKEPIEDVGKFVKEYFKKLDGNKWNSEPFPYIENVRKRASIPIEDDECGSVIANRLRCPLFLELIWSYFHEEGMLCQAMNAISLRFQNRALDRGRNPLAVMNIDPLRRLNNVMWGYIQDAPNRLTVSRRSLEYNYEYGMTLQGRATEGLNPADSRSRFLPAFHNLVATAWRFYQDLDDLTRNANPFGVLNGLRELHMILGEGAHNQYGDLPWTSRREMYIEQWMLGRPEMRDFFGGRIMVPYEQNWMDRLDSIKKIMSWTDTSVVNFHNLAVWGEIILLSVRFGPWRFGLQNSEESARTWATTFRSEIQGYIHAYRSVTGVDLTADQVDTTDAGQRDLPPSVHLQRRLVLQQGRTA